MDPATIALLIGLGIKIVYDAIDTLYKEYAKGEARGQAEKTRSDLDTLLGTETGKLTTEYEAQSKRLGEYKETVLGSQRQGFAARGDFGGADTAAALVITTTENKATEDEGFLKAGYQAGVDVLAQQTTLAKDQLDSNLNQYLSGVTASQIANITGIVSDAFTTLGEKKLLAPTLLDTPSPGGSYDYFSYFRAGWDPSLGVPRIRQ